MTFQEWLDESEGLGTREGRLLYDFAMVLTIDEYDRLLKWLEAAYMEGFKNASANQPARID